MVVAYTHIFLEDTNHNKPVKHNFQPGFGTREGKSMESATLLTHTDSLQFWYNQSCSLDCQSEMVVGMIGFPVLLFYPNMTIPEIVLGEFT